MGRFLGVVVGAALAFSTVAAHAATVTRTFEFTASDFQLSSGPPGPAPVDPVTGSITLTFDDLTFVADQPVDRVNDLNLTVGGPVGFTYNPGFGGNYFLLIGGVLGGFDTADSFGAGTSDFFLSMYYPLDGTPSFGSLSYAQAGAASSWYSGTVTIRAFAGGVPEPTSWSLMIVGFAAVGGVLRKPRRAAYR